MVNSFVDGSSSHLFSSVHLTGFWLRSGGFVILSLCIGVLIAVVFVALYGAGSVLDKPRRVACSARGLLLLAVQAGYIAAWCLFAAQVRDRTHLLLALYVIRFHLLRPITAASCRLSAK